MGDQASKNKFFALSRRLFSTFYVADEMARGHLMADIVRQENISSNLAWRSAKDARSRTQYFEDQIDGWKIYYEEKVRRYLILHVSQPYQEGTIVMGAGSRPTLLSFHAEVYAEHCQGDVFPAILANQDNVLLLIPQVLPELSHGPFFDKRDDYRGAMAKAYFDHYYGDSCDVGSVVNANISAREHDLLVYFAPGGVKARKNEYNKSAEELKAPPVVPKTSVMMHFNFGKLSAKMTTYDRTSVEPNSLAVLSCLLFCTPTRLW